jgi:curved DNA-binding protein CbpA
LGHPLTSHSAALKTHPDRVAHNDPTRPARTKKFQEVNDAYFVLSDPTRRADYDATRAYTSRAPPFSAESQFGDIFEEMMREEGLDEDEAPTAGAAQGTGSVWSLLGGLSGATIGFIVGNVPGLLAGAVAGNRLGAIRDKKGQSVYQVFQELPQADKAKVFNFSFDVGVEGASARSSFGGRRRGPDAN